MSVQLADGPYDAVLFICKETYCIQVYVRISSNAILTVACLVDTGAGPNLVNKDFLSHA